MPDDRTCWDCVAAQQGDDDWRNEDVDWPHQRLECSSLTGHFGPKTLRTHKIRTEASWTLITYNLVYNCGHGSECPDDQSVLRHFGTGSKVFHAGVLGPKCPVTNQGRIQSESGCYHRLDGTLWLAASCKLLHNIVHAQYYANEVCKTCASLAGLLVSFIIVVGTTVVGRGGAEVRGSTPVFRSTFWLLRANLPLRIFRSKGQSLGSRWNNVYWKIQCESKNPPPLKFSDIISQTVGNF